MSSGTACSRLLQTWTLGTTTHTNLIWISASHHATHSPRAANTRTTLKTQGGRWCLDRPQAAPGCWHQPAAVMPPPLPCASVSTRRQGGSKALVRESHSQSSPATTTAAKPRRVPPTVQYHSCWRIVFPAVPSSRMGACALHPLMYLYVNPSTRPMPMHAAPEQPNTGAEVKHNKRLDVPSWAGPGLVQQHVLRRRCRPPMCTSCSLRTAR